MPIYEGKLTRLRTQYLTQVGRVRIEADDVDDAMNKLLELRDEWIDEELEDYDRDDRVTECKIDGVTIGDDWNRWPWSKS